MIRGYEVRIQVAAGRLTRRVAAVDAAEARVQCAALGEVVSVRRSQYAVGLAERRARAEWLEREKALREAERYEAMAGTCAVKAQSDECLRLAALARDRARA